MTTLLHDLRFSLRMLTKSPLFTGIALLTLMLGIGLNATTFSAVNGLLLKPLGGTDQPEELVQLYREWAGIEFGSNSIPHYRDLRDRGGDVFENVAAWNFGQMALSEGGRNERILGLVVSANFFQTYGVEPEIGRAFLPDVESRGAGEHAVTILGHRFWQSRFGGDPDVLGQTLQLNGRPFEIVGVAPEEFVGPLSLADVPLYVPIVMQPVIEPGNDLLEVRGSNSYNVIARLRDGVTLAQAEDALDGILAQLLEDYPDQYDQQLGTTVVRQTEAGIHPTFRDAQRAMALIIMVVVGLLLLIACVNVANLFLARARERQREIGIRLCLGAGRWRVVRQLLTESIVFSVLAGGLSLGLAHVATGALSRFRPPVDGPFAFDFGIDGRVLLFTAAVSLLTGILFGLVPALHAARPDLASGLRPGGSVRRSRASRGLVVVQMALSLVLLISSGLFLRSLQGALRIDPGFDEPRHLVTAAVDPGLQGYDEERALAFYDRLREELEARPEISAAGITMTLPLGMGSSDRGVAIPGYEFAEGERNSLHYAVIGTGYLEAMGIRLLEGRPFTRADDGDGEPVIIVNRAFVERFWPGQSGIGRIVRTAGEDRRIVGVVETGKYASLAEEPREFMYLPHRELFQYSMTVVARTPGSTAEALGAVRSTIASLDPNLPVFDVRTMTDHMGIALLPARLGGITLGVFGVLGLVLAAVGIYGVMAYSVAQRRRELGIRVALGADRPMVVQQVLGEGLRLAAVGSAVGIVLAALAARAVASRLYDTSPLDPATFIGVPLLLLGVAAAAVYLPARRAARVDPMQVLRMD